MQALREPVGVVEAEVQAEGGGEVSDRLMLAVNCLGFLIGGAGLAKNFLLGNWNGFSYCAAGILLCWFSMSRIALRRL